MDEARTQLLEENRLLLTKTKQTNRNYPVGEKQTGWLAGKAGLDKAGQGRTRLGRAGQGRAGQGRAGQGRAGQGRAGQGRAGQGRAGQGRAGHRRHLALGNEPTWNCKHKEIIKGANEEGNEGKQN